MAPSPYHQDTYFVYKKTPVGDTKIPDPTIVPTIIATPLSRPILRSITTRLLPVSGMMMSRHCPITFH